MDKFPRRIYFKERKDTSSTMNEYKRERVRYIIGQKCDCRASIAISIVHYCNAHPVDESVDSDDSDALPERFEFNLSVKVCIYASLFCTRNVNFSR